MSDSHAVNVRLPRVLIAALDELAERLTTERHGNTVTRSDAIREVLSEALAAEPASTPAKPRRAR